MNVIHAMGLDVTMVDGVPEFADAPAGRFRGVRQGAKAGVFAGIRFAAPPVGRWRFRPPRPVPDAVRLVDATCFRAAPAQSLPAFASGGGKSGEPAAAIGAALGRAEASEDCLYLNVWTPDVRGRRPVIVWVYGGGFETGSASPPLTDGGALSRLTGAVVVAANYRLGALGFGYWAGVGGPDWAESSNLGLQDQAAALAWVRRNIAAFGGDPGNVTVAGESAGAFLIGALLGAPQGLFDKAILQSGGAGRIFSAETGDVLARALLDAVGVATVEELQAVEVDRILSAQREVIDLDVGRRNLPGGRSWGVVLDGTVVPRHPLEAVGDGSTAEIPLLVGANRDEVRSYRATGGNGFVASDLESLLAEFTRAGVATPSALYQAYRERVGDDADMAVLRESFLTDAVYRRPVSDLAAAQRAAGGRVWASLFSAEPFGPQMGAFHGADLLYVFDHLAALGFDSEANRRVRDELTGAWARFVRDGDPGWDQWDAGARPNARLFGGDGFLVSEPPDDEILRLWPLQRG
ncbi:MAG: carboxylesterase family protein [Bifidobacteriaceae bacterium]|nr:carboxylesterase family protein [Bifidobacteriaceae bacterium]